MSLVLVAMGWLLLSLPGRAARWLRRGSPRETATLVAAALAVGAVVLEAGLIVCAGPTILRTAGLTRLAMACQRTFDTLVAGGPLIGWIAATAAVATVVGAVWGLLPVLRLRRRAVVEPWIGEHSVTHGFELVILPTDAPVAYSVRKPVPQIVISGTLHKGLDAPSLEALLAHEAAHLQLRHDRPLLLGALLRSALGWLPGVRSSIQTLQVALERCADDQATERAPARRAALRQALLATAGTEAPPALAAFGAANGIIERVAALQAPPCDRLCAAQRMGWMVLSLLTAAAVGTLALWLVDTHAVLAMAYCPS